MTDDTDRDDFDYPDGGPDDVDVDVRLARLENLVGENHDAIARTLDVLEAHIDNSDFDSVGRVPETDVRGIQ